VRDKAAVKISATEGARPSRVKRASELEEPSFPDTSTYDPRFTSEVVYSHLRDLIMLGFLPPGAEIKQSVLAKKLGVSRTPLREACRRLQAEGLVEIEVNQRAVVSALDVLEIDELYGARILLESLGVRLSTGKLSATELYDAEAALNEMWRASVAMDLRAWTTAHLEFHMLLGSHAGRKARQIMRTLANECDRYLFRYHRTRPFAPRTRHGEHVALLAAVRGNDADASGRLIGRHLAVTAIDLIHDLDPDRVVVGIQSALDLVDPGCDTTVLVGSMTAPA
jgi:DNA-binding GntR family transcriptional regulator